MAKNFLSWGKDLRNKPFARKKPLPPKGFRREEVSMGGNYSADQEEWIRAITEFQAKHRRYPTLEEAFAIAHALGYRKIEEGV